MSHKTLFVYLIFSGASLGACNQAPESSTARAPQPAPTSAIASTPAEAEKLAQEAAPPVVKTPAPDTAKAVVEPSTGQIIDQMLADYVAAAAEYSQLMKQSKMDAATAAHADSVLQHADDTYAGLVDAMGINTFTPQQHQQLQTTKARLDKLR